MDLPPEVAPQLVVHQGGAAVTLIPWLDLANLCSVLSLTSASVRPAVAPTDHVLVDVKYLVVAVDKVAVLLPALAGVVHLDPGVEQPVDLDALGGCGLTPASHHALTLREGPGLLGQTDRTDSLAGDDSVQSDDGDVVAGSHSEALIPSVNFVPADCNIGIGGQ